MHPLTKILWFLAAIIPLASAAQAQETPSTQPPPTQPTSTQPAASTSRPATNPSSEPAHIPLAEVATQAQTTLINLHAIESDLSSDRIMLTIWDELPDLTAEIESRLDENSKLLASSPSLQALRSMESDWDAVGDDLADWKDQLANRATQLNAQRKRLSDQATIWQRTLERAQSLNAVPQLRRRMQDVVAAIEATSEDVHKRRMDIWTLQNGVDEQQAKVIEMLAMVRQARQEAFGRLFSEDAPSLWSGRAYDPNLVADSQNSIGTQFKSLRAYVYRWKRRFIFHALATLILAGLLYWVRARVRSWMADDPNLKPVSAVFAIPPATALVLSLLAGGSIYPHGPRLLGAMLGAAALIPTILILRRLIEQRLISVLNALIFFYFIDQLRSVAASMQMLPRVLFLAQMIGGAIFLWWFIKSTWSTPTNQQAGGAWRAVRNAARVALTLFLGAFIANAAGYVSLANLVGDAILGSAYLAVILYASSRILDALIMIALRIRPLALLAIVRRHRELIQRRLIRIVEWFAVLVWALTTLELLSLRAIFLEAARKVWNASLTIGSINLAMGQVVVFILTIWSAFLLSRFLRFILEEDVYVRFALPGGIPYAISRMAHYLIVLLGFFIAIAALGYDMTKFTILVGAFGVGLGFGMQNIVNNFVSGLILLFERPIKVGDVIEMDQMSGVVGRIGIRASIVRTPDSSEIIVPNGKLISERVTNFTLSNRQRGMQLPISVACGTDPRRVIDLLKSVAAAHPQVTDTPPPQAYFVKLGPDSFDFELQAWTNRAEDYLQVRSDLAIAVNEALTNEKIPIQ